MKELIRDNAHINYRIAGSGDTTLVFVHGSYIDQSYWYDQVTFFSGRYTVVTMDLPGHGLSGNDRADWSLDGFAQDVAMLIAELGLKNVILVGHSMGAEINLIAATTHKAPILGMIAVEFFKNAATPLPEEHQPMLEKIKADLKTKFVETNEQYVKMFLVTKETPDAIVRKVIADYKSAFEPMGQRIMSDIFDGYKIEQKLFPQLQQKLYLINVNYMPTNQEPLKQYLPNGFELTEIKGTSHFPMIENAVELNNALDLAVSNILASK
ncbi:MAG: alpha/beta hydrolase [Chitinophagaceae bacterium]|nr:alpha/beta hydrolase [Chitinophagaceae bacterium]